MVYLGTADLMEIMIIQFVNNPQVCILLSSDVAGCRACCSGTWFVLRINNLRLLLILLPPPLKCWDEGPASPHPT